MGTKEIHWYIKPKSCSLWTQNIGNGRKERVKGNDHNWACPMGVSLARKYTCTFDTINLPGRYDHTHVAGKDAEDQWGPSQSREPWEPSLQFHLTALHPLLTLLFSRFLQCTVLSFLCLNLCSKCSLCLQMQLKYPLLRQWSFPWALIPG